ncbi:hypothetical protein Vretimale_8312 [Volvox reticuliferus]|uniref:Uncharacterized protein n=1 Tax=Volvox reticuliferus TaxID=1737510 RepID=A0A8J4GBB6_9CHLO|nr:hypothetical protein Vretimale_8312 [Volvox reticuliferus]
MNASCVRTPLWQSTELHLSKCLSEPILRMAPIFFRFQGHRKRPQGDVACGESAAEWYVVTSIHQEAMRHQHTTPDLTHCKQQQMAIAPQLTELTYESVHGSMGPYGLYRTR